MEGTGIVIRPMRVEDCRQVSLIEKESFSLPWSEAGFADALLKEEACYLVAEEQTQGEKGQIVGYLGFWQSFEEADITNVAVASRKRGQGIGKFLMESAIQAASQRGITALTLEVRVSNQAAIHLYEKYGFQSVGIRPGFYDKPKEDAMIMWNYSL